MYAAQYLPAHQILSEPCRKVLARFESIPELPCSLEIQRAKQMNQAFSARK